MMEKMLNNYSLTKIKKIVSYLVVTLIDNFIFYLFFYVSRVTEKIKNLFLMLAE